MTVAANWSALSGVGWQQYAIRFVLGGLVTAAAGSIAAHAGPVWGGLFLAFPALFPAGATLIEQRERRRKDRQGLEGTRRGRRAAALDAAGAVIGAIGLVLFAIVVWLGLPRYSDAVVLPAAAIAWLGLSTGLWWLHKHRSVGTPGR